MKKLLIPVHTGFEETELITTLNVLKRNKVEYILWSIEGLTQVKSSHEAIVKTHPEFPANQKFNGVFFHGGTKEIVDYDEVIHIAKTFYEEDKFVAAICAAPLILAKAGILEGKIFTAHESTRLEKNTHKEVEIDGKLITGKDYRATLIFAETFVSELKK